MDELREKIKAEYGYDGKPKQWREGFDSALKEILALLPHWTKVEDGLPEEEGEYMTYTGYSSRFTGYYRGRWQGGTRVTQWQPLPTPPKEGE